MTSICEGQPPKTRPKFQSKQGSFGFQVYLTPSDSWPKKSWDQLIPEDESVSFFSDGEIMPVMFLSDEVWIYQLTIWYDNPKNPNNSKAIMSKFHPPCENFSEIRKKLQESLVYCIFCKLYRLTTQDFPGEKGQQAMVSSGSPSSREKNVGNSVTNGTLRSRWYIGPLISEEGQWLFLVPPNRW